MQFPEGSRASRYLALLEFTLVVALFIADAHHLIPVSKTPELVLLGWISLRLRHLKWRDVGLARKRPFVGTHKITCVPRDTVGDSYSYPSGHSTLGWTFALILSELAPDRSSALMAHGRAFGESRAVCGMHWESDVEDGRYVGAAVVAALHSDPAFRADMDAVRTEVAAARSTPVPNDTPACQVENASDLKRPW